MRKRIASCTRESSLHFDKTQLWFGLTFVSLFTAPTPSQSNTQTINTSTSAPPLHQHSSLGQGVALQVQLLGITNVDFDVKGQ
jgi:hypothetical protein